MTKSKRRREARRRARERRVEQSRERAVSPEGAGPAPERTPGGEELMLAHAPEAKHSRSARKRAKRRGGLWERVGRIRVSPWLIAVPVLVIGTGIIAVLIATSGSSGGGGGGSASPTPDPRVAGLPTDQSFSVSVDDVAFGPDTVTAKAGDVIELVVTNTGTISHNLTVAGPDNEYDTGDDFESQPFAIKAGETARVMVKIDQPGTYLFRCAFHPTIETGTLVLQ